MSPLRGRPILKCDRAGLITLRHGPGLWKRESRRARCGRRVVGVHCTHRTPSPEPVPMDRRHFLKAAAAVPAAVATGPIILGAGGQGRHQAPDRRQWRTHLRVARRVRRVAGRRQLADDAQRRRGHGRPRVRHAPRGSASWKTRCSFSSASGKFVRSFGKGWHGGGHGIDVRTDGGEEFLYLTNTWKSPKVVKGDAQGRDGVDEGATGREALREPEGELQTRRTSRSPRTAASSSGTGTGRTS